MKAYRVRHIDGHLLPFNATAELIDKSLDAEPTGLVGAYLYQSEWHYANPGSESTLKACGHQIVTVYAEEI